LTKEAEIRELELKDNRCIALFNFYSLIGFQMCYNVLGIAEGGEIEAESFDLVPRLAQTNFYELNLQNKNEFYSFLAVIEVQTFNLTLRPHFWQYLATR